MVRRWRRGLAGGVLLVGLLGGAGGARAASFYVATTGTGEGTNWSTAFTNLQQALNAVDRDDTLYIAGGVYLLPASLTWTACTNVTLRGGYAATNDVVLPGSNHPARWPTVWVGPSTARVLTVTGVTSSSLERVTLTRGRGVGSARGGGISFKDCGPVAVVEGVVTNNYGEKFGGGVYVENSPVELIRCRIGDNAVDDGGGYGAAHGGGIYCLSGSLSVRDSTVFGNTVTGDAASGGGGVGVGGGTVELRNVLLAGNAAKSFGHGIYLAGGTLSMIACNAVFHYGEGLYRAGGSANLTNCLFWGNGDDLAGTIATLVHSNIEDGDGAGANGNISADPRFEYGFYLGAGSPCIDAGTNTASDYGLDGYTTRVEGDADTGRMDIGYHYAAGADLTYADLYVSGAGDDLAAGTNAITALRSLTKALTLAIDGSRIHIGAGSYTNGVESFPLTVRERAGIHFLGADPATTVVDAGNTGRVLVLEQVTGLSTLAGLTLRGGLSALPGGGLSVRNCGRVMVTNCILRDNRMQISAAIALGGGVFAEGSDLTLQACFIGYNGISTVGGVYEAYGGGVNLKSGVLRVKDSELAGNTVSATGSGYGGGLYVAGGSADLRNTRLIGNVAKSFGHAAHVNAGTLNLLHCNVLYHQTEGVRRGGGTVNLTNCIVWGNGDDLVGTIATVAHSNIEDGDGAGVNGNISADPRFEYGFYLGAGSPCIDAGTNTASDYGLDGYTTRVDGGADTGRVDIGYHYAAGADLTYADLYVSGAGDDLAAGTNAVTALRSLTKALTRSTDGSRIHVGAGSYTNGVESFPLRVRERAGIHFLGADPATTVVDAGGTGRVFVLEDLTGLSTLSGLTVRGGDTTLPGGGLYIRNCGAVTVSDCILADNRGKDAGGGLYLETSAVTLRDCRIVRNRGYTGGGYVHGYGGGLHLASGSLMVDRSVFQSNQITAGGVAYGGAVSVMGGTARLRSSLVVGNTGQAGDGVYVGGGGVALENCTLADNGGVGIQRGAGTLTATNSILWANGDDVSGVVTLGYCAIEDGDSDGVNGCISAEPRFENSGTDPYRPQRGSPCGNAGFTEPWMRTETDLAGGLRLKGGVVDLGCYEFAGSIGSIFILQ